MASRQGIGNRRRRPSCPGVTGLLVTVLVEPGEGWGEKAGVASRFPKIFWGHLSHRALGEEPRCMSRLDKSQAGPANAGFPQAFLGGPCF